jgi:glycerate-2-kinase
VVDAKTWTRIALAGRIPLRDLEGHDAYPALDAAGALLRTGMTGTNVNDVVIALVD